MDMDKDGILPLLFISVFHIFLTITCSVFVYSISHLDLSNGATIVETELLISA
jgi:hypothetical protein